MGVVTPVGNSVPAFWEALCVGRSGLAPITRFDASPYRNDLAGEIKGIEPGDVPRASAYALFALREAVRDANLADFAGSGIVLGSNFGGMDAALGFFRGTGSRDSLSGSNLADPVDRAIREYGFVGPSCCVSLSCASGAASVGMAYDTIALGLADIMIAGGFDELSELSYAGLSALRAITPDIIRPFDKNRKGTIFSEGAGVVVLESIESARQRGAKIHAEVLGHFVNNDAYHMTAPDKTGQGIREVMERAIRDAGVSPESVDYVNSHGTGTEYNDRIETSAIKQVLGRRAHEIPVDSIKSMIGHMMGAAGTVEIIATVKTIQTGIVPPTVNLETPDPECDLNYVPGKAQTFPVKIALSNSYGIGGCNAAVVLGGLDR